MKVNRYLSFLHLECPWKLVLQPVALLAGWSLAGSFGSLGCEHTEDCERCLFFLAHFLATCCRLLLSRVLPAVVGSPPQSQEQQDQQPIGGNPWSHEPKWIFSLYKVLLLCYKNRNVTNTVYPDSSWLTMLYLDFFFNFTKVQNQCIFNGNCTLNLDLFWGCW